MRTKTIHISILSIILFSVQLFGQHKAHIAINPEIPGILGLFDFRPEAAEHIRKLVGVLLAKDSTLPRSDRQLISAYVSWLNECAWCCNKIQLTLPSCLTLLAKLRTKDFA